MGTKQRDRVRLAVLADLQDVHLIRFRDAVVLTGFSADHLEIPERIVLSALAGGKVLDEEPNAAVVCFTFDGLLQMMTAYEAQSVPPGA